ncbi:hypothetical protein ABH924_001705 [Arthrobacter sp. GAS37]
MRGSRGLFGYCCRVSDEVTGTFWLANGPRIEGTLKLESGTYSLELNGFCFTPQSWDIQPGFIGLSGDPAAITADFAPRTIYGELDGAGPVTLLRAHMDTDLLAHMFGPLVQRFTGPSYVLNAHIKGEDHEVHGIRWTYNFSTRHAGWLQDSPVGLTDGPVRGQLKPWVSEKEPGFELQLSGPAELRVVRQGVMGASTQFLVLWTGCEMAPRHVEIKLGDGNWHECSAPPPGEGKFSRTRLLPLGEVTLQALSRWLPMAFRLDPLPYIASDKAGVLQIDAQAVATALEGLHRRLRGDPRVFAPVSAGAVKRATRAARETGVQKLVESGFDDEDLATRLFSEALNNIDQPSYQQRLLEMASPVVEVAPGLCGPDLSAWVKSMRSIRNDQSHQLLDHFYDEEITQYHIASISGRWVLVLRILLEFADPTRLGLALGESQIFAFALANMDVEDYWPGFSCLQTFRASQETSG